MTQGVKVADLEYQRATTPVSSRVAATAAGGAVTAAGAAAAGTATAGTAAVGGLLTAAGASATVPFAGWIVAGGLALAAGTVALVGGLRRGKLNRRAAVIAARRAGIPNPESAPRFVVRVLRLQKKNPKKLLAVAGHKARKLARTRRSRRREKLEAELRIIGAVIAFSRAEARGKAPAEAPVEDLAQEHGEDTAMSGLSDVPWAWYAGGAALIGLAILYRSRT